VKTCCTPGCTNELSPNGRMRTCVNCRASAHRWEKRRPPEVLNYFQQLRVRTNRMSLFAVVKDDEVVFKDRAELERKRLITFPARRKAKSNVVAFKKRNNGK
jgi:hypothetical protein